MSVEHYVPNLFLVKRNKRLLIVDGADEVVYTPPDHLKAELVSRDDMQALIDEIQAGRHQVDAIVAFETMLMNRKIRRIGKRFPKVLEYLAKGD